MEAKKVQNGNGVKGNRNFAKEDLVSKHRKSKIDLKDKRSTKIEIRLTHPRKSVQVKTIELYRLESEKLKWGRDGWNVDISN